MANKVAYHNLIVDVVTGAGTEATITVYAAGTVTASTIYSDTAGTAKANPFTTDSVGRFSFYADPGLYDIKVSGSGLTTYTVEDVQIGQAYDELITSAPTSGEHRVKKLRIDAATKIVVTYDGTPEA